MTSEKTLCNLSNGIVALCDGATWVFGDQKKYCDGASTCHTSFEKNESCIHLCLDERCDSHIAQDIAVKLSKK